jgi:hypothetical protein
MGILPVLDQVPTLKQHLTVYVFLFLPLPNLLPKQKGGLHHRCVTNSVNYPPVAKLSCDLVQEVQQNEQNNPNHIHEVPVQLCGFYTKVMLTGIMTFFERSQQHRPN